MGLFGKSKFDKLQEQISDTPYSDQVKQLELCNEMLTHLLSQNKALDRFHLACYYMDKSMILYGLRRYAESLESWEKSDEIYTYDRILPTSAMSLWDRGTNEGQLGAAPDIVLKSKLLNKLGKYAESLNCINSLEEHFAKCDMSYEEIHNNNYRKLDILDTINIEIPEVKIYSMYKCGSPKSEITSYLQYLHNKIYFTERDGRNHQKQIAILITNVNQWEFKPGLGIPKEEIPPKDEIPTKDVPLNIFKIRLAKGEITIEEYKKIKEILEDDEKIRLNPKNADAWFWKGLALTTLKKYEESIVCYTEAIILNPKHDDVWNFKGLALKELGRHEEAEECFAESKKLDES